MANSTNAGQYQSPELAGRYHETRRLWSRLEARWMLGYPEPLRPASDAERPLILDLAAGGGLLAQAVLKDRGLDDRRVVAIDTSPAMLNNTSKDRDLMAVAGNAEAIPLPDGSVSAAVMGDASFLRDAAYEEIARVLAPGGVVSSVWHNLLLPGDKMLKPWARQFFGILRSFIPDRSSSTELPRTQRNPKDRSKIRKTWDAMDFGPEFTTAQMKRYQGFWKLENPEQSLVALLLSSPYVADAPPEKRNIAVRKVAKIGRSFSGKPVSIPFRSEVHRAYRLPNSSGPTH